MTRGFGSFLTLEFGAPRLVVREPQSSATDVSRRVQQLLARRSVHARGRWHLWIYCCEWRVIANDRVVGDSTTPRRIDRAARGLNGQKLLEVKIAPRGARSRFVFDLGAELETRPYDRSSEQWLLYEPSGHVLTWRADRKFAYARAGRNPRHSRWRALSTTRPAASDRPSGRTRLKAVHKHD